MPVNEGDIFDDFVIQRLLGVGGMGEVYLAQHPRLPRLTSLKILSTDAARDQEFRARFTREAELAASLSHPHIVGVLDRGEFDGRLWISMDYVEGTDARHLVEQQYPTGMPHQDVVEIVTAVAEALDYAHEQRLLHRDVKPANILVTTPSDNARRRVLLTDFGIARETDDISGITEEDMAVGTVAYAAPEQLTGNTLDGRVDQYALAATAFHLLTGAPPFDSANRAVVVGDHLHTAPPRLSTRRPELARLDAVMAKALAKLPDDRYPRCIDFANALSEPPTAAALDQTAPLIADDRAPYPSTNTKRLQLMTVHGTARDVRQTPAEPGTGQEVWTLRVERYESTGKAHTVVPVELRGDSITGQLVDGDVVEVTGFWDDHTLFADSLVNHSVGSRGRRGTTKPKVTSNEPAAPKSRKTRVIATVVALVAVLAAVAVAAAFTSGFGLWSGASAGQSVKPERATVFSPGGAPDHPDEASLAIDGDPNTSWPTDDYRDATPFPAFKQGVGLILQLPGPTALSEVTVDVPSTGTEIQIRAAQSANPASVADTVELTPGVTLQQGHNTITVDNHTETSYVLVWITKLGTTDGQSRTAISDITLRAVA